MSKKRIGGQLDLQAYDRLSGRIEREKKIQRARDICLGVAARARLGMSHAAIAAEVGIPESDVAMLLQGAPIASGAVHASSGSTGDVPTPSAQLPANAPTVS